MMLDYLSLSESKNVIWDKWTLLRIFYLILVSVGFFLNRILQQNWDFWIEQLFVMSSIFELSLFIYKIFKKKINLPIFSLKALLILVLNFCSLSILGVLIFYKLAVFELPMLLLFILLIPFFIVFWVIILTPIDSYLKESVFKKAKIDRQKLVNLQAVAVSGAYGKSTIKEVLTFLLSQKFVTEKTFKNQNVNYSCAKKISSLSNKTEFFVCELGSYSRGDGKKICEFLKPTISIISGLNNQHFSLFGSEENIILGESESLDFLPEKSLVAINWNSKMNHKIPIPEGKNLRIFRYGVVENLFDAKEFDIYATNLHLSLDFTLFDLVYKNQTYSLKTNLASRGNIENLVGVLALILNLGFEISEIENKLLELPDFEGSLSIGNKTWGKIIDDSYNANFDGVKNVLELLGNLKKNSNQNNLTNPNLQTLDLKTSFKKPLQTVILLDDIMELGSKSMATHQDLGKIIFDNQIDWVFLLGRNFAEIIAEELIKRGFDKTKIIFRAEKNPKKVSDKLEQIIRNSNYQKVILFEGYQSRKYLIKV